MVMWDWSSYRAATLRPTIDGEYSALHYHIKQHLFYDSLYYLQTDFPSSHNPRRGHTSKLAQI